VYFISFRDSCSSLLPPKSNIETCPCIPFLLFDCIWSIISSKDASNVLLVCSNSSKQPAFIKLSTHFLFTASFAILSQKSVKLWYFPFFSLSFTIISTGIVPTFFMLPNPKRILFCSTVNLVLLLFISGFKISIPSVLHSSTYCGILSKFPKKLFNIAAINSAG